MNIYVNDEPNQVQDKTTLQILINSIEIERKKGIAIAVDNQVIPRNQWGHFYLKESSKVVIIQATQGG